MKDRLARGLASYANTSSGIAAAGGALLPTEYLGQIGTRCYPPDSFFSTHKECVSDQVIFLRDATTSFQIENTNWWIDAGSETSPAATVNFRVSVEYPVGSGTWVKATYSGADSGACASGLNIKTDPITAFNIPSGGKIKVRTEQKSTGGIMFVGGYLPPNAQSVMGEGIRSVVSGLADYMSGAPFVSTSSTAMYGPQAVIGLTRRPSVAEVGDSRMFGAIDTCDSTGDWGEVSRSIGPLFGYMNLATPGERASQFLAAHTKRAALANAYCSHIICEYGGADLNQTADSAATIYSNVLAIEALFPGKVFFCTTSTPQSLSSVPESASSVDITSLTSVGTTATATVASTAALMNDQKVIVSGATPTEYNGTKQITVVNATTFTYPITSVSDAPATGTLKYTVQWTDVENQTPSGYENRRNQFNSLVRTHPRHFDTCAGIEVDRTGKWQVSPNGTAYVVDGVHENQAGYLKIKESGVIQTWRITRNPSSPF